MRLWTATVEYWSKLDEDWNAAFSLERGRFLFASAEAAKAAGNDLFSPAPLEWFETPNGDWSALYDATTRVSVSWVEGHPQGGRD